MSCISGKHADHDYMVFPLVLSFKYYTVKYYMTPAYDLKYFSKGFLFQGGQTNHFS